MREQPLITEDEKGRKVWQMPNGQLVPYIAGGSTDDDDDNNDDNNDDALSPDEVKKMQAALKKANKEAGDNRRALKKLQESAEGFDPEEFKRLQEEEANRKTKNLEDKGEYEKLLTNAQSKFDTQLGVAQQGAEKWKGRYEKLVVDNALLGGAASANAINPEAVVTLVRQDYEINVNDDGNVEIMKDGKIALDDKGNTLSPGGVVTTYLGANQYLVKASGKSGTGSDGNRGENEDKSTMTAKERIAAGLKKRQV